jgi:hypothetical protein
MHTFTRGLGVEVRFLTTCPPQTEKWTLQANEKPEKNIATHNDEMKMANKINKKYFNYAKG